MEYIIKKNQLELSHRKKEGLLKLAKIIQWGRRFPVDFLERFSGMTLLDNQVYVFMNSWSTPNCVWCQCRNSGKALALDTPVPTAFGFTTMGELKIGDYVLDENAKSTRVTYVSEVFYNHDCYLFEFDDGEVIISDKDHLWQIKNNFNDEILNSKSIFDYFNKGNLLYIPYSKFNISINNLGKKIINIKKVNSVPTKCISVDNPNSLYLCGKNFTVTHNTTLAAPFIFSKAILIPNFNAYILSGTGDQAKEMFTKIEQITKREIASFTGLTDVFFNETVKNVANKDGFTHSPASYKFSLYNGSKVQTLNSKPDNVRSRRSNLNVYDEAGFIDEALFEASEPFLTQDSNFKLGGDIDITLEAKSFANQVVYASSASSTDTYFWRKYKEFSKKMFLNDKRYFVADINDEIVLNATHRGKIYPVALLTQETIDRKIRENYEAGMREYKNIFSKDGGDEQAVKRASIIKNSEVRPPMLFNDAKRKFVLAYDPARTYDNSVVMVAELIRDPNVGYKLKICNGVSFVDISKKKKTPMQTPIQTELLKEMILDYNGKMAADYENIDALLIDTGAGGGGMAICDYFMKDWVDKKGNKHKGLIDKEFSADYVSKFPNAANKIKAIVPQKHRTDMFDAMVEMIGLDLVSFPAEYDMKGYITMYDDIIDEKGEIEQKRKMYRLSQEEELALKNIDLAKEEIVSIHKTRNNIGRISYGLPPEKKNKMHDDRVFCIAMLCWHLHQLRRNDVIGKKAPEIDWMDYVFHK